MKRAARSGSQRRTAEPASKSISRPVAIQLPESRFIAGDVITGRIDPAASTPVVLVRLERRPGAQRAIVVAQALPADADRSFELEIPSSALPTASGRRCSISYVLRTTDRGTAADAELEVSATARVHLDARPGRLDRLFCQWDARHFHIELSDGAPHGGARLAGRVHRDQPWPAGPITVEARCEEWWRTQFAFHGIPQWQRATLWRSERQLEMDCDATWERFAFDLPRWLPPAVEGRSIAWRYELWATRARRVRDETAALTPLMFEDAAYLDADQTALAR
jgi:hypothetical protein